MGPRISVYVYTLDLERMRRFYEGGLGVKPGAQHGNWLPFDLGGGTFALRGVADEAFGKRAIVEDPEGRTLEIVSHQEA